jgi:regulator of sirC expression with transglutaminase-like and TPR domain
MIESEIRAMVSLLEDEDKEVLKMVEKQIFELGAEAIPYLEDEWARQFDPDVQKRIENILQSINYSAVRDRLWEWANSQEKDLLKGMWIVATLQYPDLEIDDLQKKIEQLYFEAWVNFKPELQAIDQVKLLNAIFFNSFKFKSNTSNIKAVSNSMINNVLGTKKSNPIGLCVLYMLIAQKLKIPIYGVNLPNIFILTYKTERLQFYINVFNKGLTFSKQDIDHYIAQLDLTPRTMFYEPCTHLDIIKRVLRNLVVAYEEIGNTEKMEDAQSLLDDLSNLKSEV